MGVAVARAAAGELALVAIPALKGAAQRARHRTGPAAHLKHIAVGGVTQHHQAGIAGDAACRLFADVDAPGLLDYRLLAVGDRWRGDWAVAVRGLDQRLVRSGVRRRCRRGRGRRVALARFRRNARRGSGGLVGAKGLRFDVHRNLEAIGGAAGIDQWYTRFSAPPWRPVDEPIVRFDSSSASNTGAARRERALRAEMRTESGRSGMWRNQAPNTASTPRATISDSFLKTTMRGGMGECGERRTIGSRAGVVWPGRGAG